MWGHVSLLWNCATPNISGTVESRNFKFGTEMEGSEYEGKNENLVEGVMWGSRDPLLEFLGPPNISGAVKARNFKIGKEMAGSEY